MATSNVEDEEDDTLFLPWTEFFVPYVPLDWRTTCLDGEQVDAREARTISRTKNRTFVVRPGFVQRSNSPGFIHESATASREPETYDLSDGPIVRSFVAISFWRTMVTSSSRADGTAFYFVFLVREKLFFWRKQGVIAGFVGFFFLFAWFFFFFKEEMFVRNESLENIR